MCLLILNAVSYESNPVGLPIKQGLILSSSVFDTICLGVLGVAIATRVTGTSSADHLPRHYVTAIHVTSASRVSSVAQVPAATHPTFASSATFTDARWPANRAPRVRQSRARVRVWPRARARADVIN